MALINELRTQGDFLFRYRGTLPVLIIIPALVVFAIHEIEPSALRLEWEEVMRYTALAVSLLGLIIRSHAVGYAAPVTSGRNTDVGQKAEVLNRTGLYSVVRHPLYLGNFFMWLGPALWTMDLWFVLFFIALFWLYYERIMFAEERFLEDKFGEDYLSWAAGRPAFIPRMSGYVASERNMNWRKVIRQERTGFLATFAVFFLFDLVGGMVRHGLGYFEWNFWSISALVALVIQLILKAMKRSPILQDRPSNSAI